jgi:hypothetical protein
MPSAQTSEPLCVFTIAKINAATTCHDKDARDAWCKPAFGFELFGVHDTHAIAKHGHEPLIQSGTQLITNGLA